MKHLLVLAAVLAATLSAEASTVLKCASQDGNVATLTIADHRQAITWSEPWHSAASAGVAAGKETAPYSEIKGYDRFQLVDFYATNDSSYVLALSPVAERGYVKAVVYFDNDDHMEDETAYLCR